MSGRNTKRLAAGRSHVDRVKKDLHAPRRPRCPAPSSTQPPSPSRTIASPYRPEHARLPVPVSMPRHLARRGVTGAFVASSGRSPRAGPRAASQIARKSQPRGGSLRACRAWDGRTIDVVSPAGDRVIAHRHHQPSATFEIETSATACTDFGRAAERARNFVVQLYSV